MAKNTNLIEEEKESEPSSFLSKIIKNKKKELVALFSVLTFLWAPEVKNNSFIDMSFPQANAQTSKKWVEKNKKMVDSLSEEQQNDLYMGEETIKLWIKYYQEWEIEKAIIFLEEWIKKWEKIEFFITSMEYVDWLTLLAFSKTILLYRNLLEKDYELIKITSDKEWEKYRKEELPKVFTVAEMGDIEFIADISIQAQELYNYHEKNAWVETNYSFFYKKLNAMASILAIWKFLGNPETMRDSYSEIFAIASKLEISHMESSLLYSEFDLLPVIKNSKKKS